MFSIANECWYCRKEDNLEDMTFSIEFDTCVHFNCAKEALDRDKNDREAQIICKEIGVIPE